MSKVRETLITNCEKKFLIKCLSEWNRLDGRAFDEFRPLQIQFGKDWGCCFVSLGKTRVLAQTSCEIQQPKSSRPSEGILNVNIELNPLAAPHFEPGRQSELSVQLNRLLEKCVKDSKAVDLESLCIKTSEKVWALRVDINVINHEGNILDCASIAMLASLAHFRRPDVTCDGEEFIIHSYQQRDPIPTVIHHYPVCVTFSIFNGGEYILADPSLIEEGIADAVLIIGLNGFKELCGLHLGGKAELMPNTVLSTVNKATSRAAIVIEEIKNSIKIDNEARQQKLPVGFHVNINFKNSVTAEMGACLDQWNKKKKRNKKKDKAEIVETNPHNIEVLGKGSAAYVPKEENPTWEVNSEDDLMIVENDKEKVHVVDADSDEDVIILSGNTQNQINS
ncbi:RNase PH domain containing protein [Asbolus verrucosus]|uniref:Exosome complex component RRP45 n=1 Tax=Asbolus verrucosus TaxID=1661398 RepID=A0A482VA83_ASBVE|nr:RNase PH domain containing protein [Asbolus verrucosus]